MMPTVNKYKDKNEILISNASVHPLKLVSSISECLINRNEVAMEIKKYKKGSQSYKDAIEIIKFYNTQISINLGLSSES